MNERETIASILRKAGRRMAVSGPFAKPRRRARLMTAEQVERAQTLPPLPPPPMLREPEELPDNVVELPRRPQYDAATQAWLDKPRPGRSHTPAHWWRSQASRAEEGTRIEDKLF